MNKYIILGVLILLLLGGMYVFGNKVNSSRQASDNTVRVSASFYPLYFFSSEIGKEKATVYNITPAGAEPHDYEPTTQDIARIEKGNMLVLNGGVEAWASDVEKNLQGSNLKIVVAGKGFLTKEITEDGEKMKDPHVWLDPVLAKKEAQRITQGYMDIDPDNKAYYAENQKQLDAKFDALDKIYKGGLAQCQSRDIVTSHAAFAYLASRYNLKQIAISGLSPDQEPSAQQIAAVAEFAKKNNVKYIFFETLVSPKLAQTVASEIGAKTLVLDPIEGLSDDDIRNGKNYVTVMEDNLKNLQIALDCK